MNRKQVKRKKYGNETCRCVQGHIHDSCGEAKYCTELYYQVISKDIKSYEIQRKYPLVIDRKSYGYMRVDFEVIGKDSVKYIIEYKGMPTPKWWLKVKLFKACYPDIEYRIVWHKDKRS
jgi:hypothetical protein